MFWNRKHIVKTYHGTLVGAKKAFARDSIKKQKKGYVPTSETWEPGSYSVGNVVVALFLTVFVIGIFILTYMLLVPAKGRLVVTYARQEK